jgi:hypothetical protein
VTGANVEPRHRAPAGRLLLALSYAGLVLLGGTALFYLFTLGLWR